MTSRPLTNELLLVGSLPVQSSEEAFRTGTELFGDLIFALPDGEWGSRAGWAYYEAQRLIFAHPDIEVKGPNNPPEGGDAAFTFPSVKLREGVEELRWDAWPRIDDAIESYRIFRSLRDEGVIPAGLRFQVGLPFPVSALIMLSGNQAHDLPIAIEGYIDLAAREIGRMLTEIPAEDLAIQWDVCLEVLDLEEVLPMIHLPKGGAWDRFTSFVDRLGPLVPENVLLGYHLCYGTAPEWPMYEARDMGLLVRMANYAAAHSGRPVDWLHMAGPRPMRSTEERFFAPLSDLDIGDARVFLGIILPADGRVGLRLRHATASKFLSEFGVANYCGFGRQPGVDHLETMRRHRDTVLGLHSAAGA